MLERSFDHDKISRIGWSVSTSTLEYTFVNHGQIIDVQVWDENRRGKDDFVGSARFTVGEVLLNGGSIEIELTKEGNPIDKYLTFKCELTQ